MSDVAFYWLGVGVALTVAVAVTVVALGYLYAILIHDRFGLIFFRKTQRRLSIASWYNAKLMNDEHFHADDWPVNERPFYLSYEIGERRLFVMAGILEPRRNMPISGKHPEGK